MNYTDHDNPPKEFEMAPNPPPDIAAARDALRRWWSLAGDDREHADGDHTRDTAPTARDIHLAACGHPVEPALYLWTGADDEPPQQLRVEVCTTCAALVPLASFDIHGQWHARAQLR